MSAMPDSTFADPHELIADLQRQLAASNAERDEALEQQTATAEVLQVINASPGDLKPVFEAILEKAHNLCGADFGGLLVYDGGQFQAAAFHNVPPSFAELARRPFRPGPKNRLTNLIQAKVWPTSLICAMFWRKRPETRCCTRRSRSVACEPFCSWPCARMRRCSGSSPPIAGRCGRSRTSRSCYCRTSRRRRSSR